MPSLILQTASRLLHPLLLLISVFLLVRGHNEPGGGFVGGLMAAAAFALHAIAYDVPFARRALRIEPHVLVGGGLLCAMGSGLVGMTMGQPFLTSRWASIDWEEIHFALGTPVLFDIGVYAVVLGVTTTIVFTLREE